MWCNQSFFINTHRSLVLNTLDDVRGKRGGAAGLVGGGLFKKNNIPFSVLPTPEEAERELAAGVADIWAVHDVVAAYTIKRGSAGWKLPRRAADAVYRHLPGLQSQNAGCYGAEAEPGISATARNGKLEKIVAKYLK